MARLLESIARLRDSLAPLRRDGTRIGLVPTMGALHAGHARLVEQARRECDCVVVSIFVNPLQFDRRDDLERYPRTLQADVEFCTARGVGIVFAPAETDMYPSPPSCAMSRWVCLAPPAKMAQRPAARRHAAWAKRGV